MEQIEQSSKFQSRDLDGIMDQTAPAQIRGLHGQRMIAYEIASRTDLIDEIPKVYPHSRAPLQKAEGSYVELSDQKIMTDVGVHLFTRADGQTFRIRGQLLPPDPEPLSAAYIGNNQWFIKGGPLTLGWGTSSGDDYQTWEIPDTTVKGEEGWIALALVGSYVTDPGATQNTFRLHTQPTVTFFERLSHDLTTTKTASTTTRGGERGMIPLNWVSTKRGSVINFSHFGVSDNRLIRPDEVFSSGGSNSNLTYMA